MLRRGDSVKLGSLQELILYEAEARERRVRVLETCTLSAAALGQGKEAYQSFLQYADTVFPENIASRQKFERDNTAVLNKATKQGVIQVLAPRRRDSGWDKLKRVTVKTQEAPKRGR